MMVNIPKYKSKQATPSKIRQICRQPASGLPLAPLGLPPSGGYAVKNPSKSVKFAVSGVAFAVCGVNPCDGIKSRKGQCTICLKWVETNEVMSEGVDMEYGGIVRSRWIGMVRGHGSGYEKVRGWHTVWTTKESW